MRLMYVSISSILANCPFPPPQLHFRHHATSAIRFLRRASQAFGCPDHTEHHINTLYTTPPPPCDYCDPPRSLYRIILARTARAASIAEADP